MITALAGRISVGAGTACFLEFLALTRTERTALTVATLMIGLALLTFIYCVVQIARVRQLAHRTEKRTAVMAGVLGMDVDELDQHE